MVQDWRGSHNRGGSLNSPMERRVSIFNPSGSQYPEERLDSTLRYGMQSARCTLQPMLAIGGRRVGEAYLIY